MSMTVDELRTVLADLPGNLPVTFRADYHVNLPVSGHVLLDDELFLTPYETPALTE